MKEERIQKVMSQQGLCSRRAAEEMIKQGRVKLNGHPVGLGDKMGPRDVLSVDGERVQLEKRTEFVYYMLNKPRGYVTTMSDEKNRKCVTDLMDVEKRVFPVGRLDMDSEGLLLLTNDGELTNALLGGKSGITKYYRVTVHPTATEEQIIALSSGVKLDDGYVTQPIIIRTLAEEPTRTVLEFALNEGKNRQIRRMCTAVGLEVARLRRIAEGPLRLGMLKTGQYRELTKTEVAALKNAAGLR